MKNNRKTYQEMGLLPWAKEEAESRSRKQEQKAAGSAFKSDKLQLLHSANNCPGEAGGNPEGWVVSGSGSCHATCHWGLGVIGETAQKLSPFIEGTVPFAQSVQENDLKKKIF